MTRLERAKQFMPFAALHGFDEIIKEKETAPTVKRELDAEESRILDEIIVKLKKGDLVQVEYYSSDKYVKIEGVITEIDLIFRKIRVVKTDIPFEIIKSIGLIK